MNVRHAVITGGSSGLGLALAVRLAARGTDTTLVSRDPARLEEAAEAVRGNTSAAVVRTMSVDVSDPDAVADAIGGLARDAGPIDLLINSAGILREGYFEDLDPADFRDVMDINFFGTVHAVRAALPHLKASKGAVVNIASLAGLSGVFGYTSYCASKHAVVGFSNSLRLELEPQGVRVHVVCPGEFDSPMVDVLDQSRTKENRENAMMLPKLGVDVIADDTIRGIESNQDLIIPGRPQRLSAIAQRLAPGLVKSLTKRRIAKVYLGPLH